MLKSVRHNSTFIFKHIYISCSSNTVIQSEWLQNDILKRRILHLLGPIQATEPLFSELIQEGDLCSIYVKNSNCFHKHTSFNCIRSPGIKNSFFKLFLKVQTEVISKCLPTLSHLTTTYLQQLFLPSVSSMMNYV
jgi:hypothetical protein